MPQMPRNKGQKLVWIEGWRAGNCEAIADHRLLPFRTTSSPSLVHEMLVWIDRWWGEASLDSATYITLTTQAAITEFKLRKAQSGRVACPRSRSICTRHQPHFERGQATLPDCILL